MKKIVVHFEEKLGLSQEGSKSEKYRFFHENTGFL